MEYLPHLSGSGESYFDRKLAYLAWRYQDVPVIDLSADPVFDGDLEGSQWMHPCE